MVVLKIIGVVLIIILAILELVGFASVAFLLFGNQETEEINNKTSE